LSLSHQPSRMGRRNLQYYQRFEDSFEALEQVYDERFDARYGFFRPYVKQVIYRFLHRSPLLIIDGFPKTRSAATG